MAEQRVETLLAYHSLTAPLVRTPNDDLENVVNELRIKYRTYYVEYDIEDGAVMLPNLFAADFGDQINSYATLIDPNNNQFEVLVNKINGSVFFSKGWRALRDFYNINLGAWITLVFLSSGNFALIVKDRFGKVIKYPTFDPPMHFTFSYQKRLTKADVNSGWLMLPYQGYCDDMLDRGTTALAFIDECGNKWAGTLVFGTEQENHCKIGGAWKRFLLARRVLKGATIKIGVPMAGHNGTIYVTLINN